MQHSSRLDMEALEELKVVMDGEFDFLLSTFVQDAVDRMHDIEMARHDWQHLRRAAHSFKGSSSNVGALALWARCRDLEAHCQHAEAEGDPTDDGTTDRLIQAIHFELEATAAAFKDEFDIG